MTDRPTPVTEDELHAYIDGELPSDRRGAVEAWLANHPDDANLVGAWRAQAEMIRARYGAAADEEIPARLKLDQLLRNGRRWRAAAAAATVAAFIIGGVAGWMARGASAAAPDAFQTFTSEALAAHQLYIGEVRHPIEVGATENHLLPWLSRRVGTQLRAPDLTAFDFRLLGGRLLPSATGPAALFMYESGSGERVTLYCAHLKEPPTGLRYTAADNFAAGFAAENGTDSAFPAAGVALEGTIERDLDGRTAAEAEDRYRAALAAERSRDTAAGRTLSGPHLSDLRIRHRLKDAPAETCSTGEQKALLIGMVLVQARLAARLSGETPIVLLDEIAAHLDKTRREALFGVLDDLGCQTFMTGTDAEVFAPLGASVLPLAVDAGRIGPIGAP